MTDPVKPPDGDAGADTDQHARLAAVTALLAPVPLTPVPTQPRWTDTSTYRTDPKSLY
jgi:hypothetical protein